MGCTAAIVFTCLGASYGTAKSGVGIAAMGVLRPDLIVKSEANCPPFPCGSVRPCLRFCCAVLTTSACPV